MNVLIIPHSLGFLDKNVFQWFFFFFRSISKLISQLILSCDIFYDRSPEVFVDTQEIYDIDNEQLYNKFPTLLERLLDGARTSLVIFSLLPMTRTTNSWTFSTFLVILVNWVWFQDNCLFITLQSWKLTIRCCIYATHHLDNLLWIWKQRVSVWCLPHTTSIFHWCLL